MFFSFCVSLGICIADLFWFVSPSNTERLGICVETYTCVELLSSLWEWIIVIVKKKKWGKESILKDITACMFECVELITMLLMF